MDFPASGENILVTGSAGFIGAEVTLRLLSMGAHVVGLDNHCDYYDPALKEARVERFLSEPGYTHVRMDLANRNGIEGVFEQFRPTNYGTVTLIAPPSPRCYAPEQQ